MVLEVYSSVHSKTFPAKSYIPILLNESSAPVDNNILSIDVFDFSVAFVHPEPFGAYFRFAFVIFHALSL